MKKKLIDCIKNEYENRIAPFLWLHWEDDALILDELDKIYESGIRAVCLESRTHEDFCRDGWWEDITLILNRCRELGMKAWILDDKHFPSGYGNGIFKDKYRNLRHSEITERHVDVTGPMKDACVLANEWKSFDDDEIMAAILCRRDETKDSDCEFCDARDITACLKDGTVYLDIPEGYWRIVLLIKTKQRNNPYGDYSDALNPLATDAIIEEIYEAHYREVGEYFGNTLLGFFSDEPGFHNNQETRLITPLGEKYANYPWNSIVCKKMHERFGNTMWEKLVNLFFEVKGQCCGAREGYMDIITRQYNESYSARLAAWCHAHGVMYIGHIIEDMNAASKTGSTAGNYFRALEGQDMSGIDVVLTQLLPGMDDISHTKDTSATGYLDYRFFRYTLAKLASSMAHANERMDGRAMCEIFGAYGWAEGSKIMKWLTDFMLVRGINYFVPHAFSPKENDKDCPPNFYARGKNPQFKYFKIIMTHMNRGAHLLTCGEAVVSCAVLYDTEIRWNGGAFLSCDKVAQQLLNHQIDFDYISHDYLLSAELATDGIRVGRSVYNTVLVPYAESFPHSVLVKLAWLEESGINIVWIDKTPFGTSNGEAADGLIQNKKTISLHCLASYMHSIGLYDVKILNENNKIKSCHRKKGNEHMYMFVNESIHEEICIKVELKDFKGGDYVVYDTLTNEVYRNYSPNGCIEITLQPYGSLMLFHGIDCSEFAHQVKYKRILEKEFFEYDLALAQEGKPYSNYAHLCTPIFGRGPNGVRDFAGHMRYSTTFQIEKEGSYELDFGRVGEIAELYINGIKVGERICPPYSFEIDARVGENKLEIIVTNTLALKERDIFSLPVTIEPSGLMSNTKLYRKEKI